VSASTHPPRRTTGHTCNHRAGCPGGIPEEHPKHHRQTRGGNSLREKGRSDCRQQPACGATGGCLQERIQNCDFRTDGQNISIAAGPSTTSGEKLPNQEKSGRIGAGPSARPRARWTNRDFSGRIGAGQGRTSWTVGHSGPRPAPGTSASAPQQASFPGLWPPEKSCFSLELHSRHLIPEVQQAV